MSAPLKKARSEPAPLLQQAMQLHQAGRLDEAQVLYQRLLSANPRHADALHLMGLTHAQRQQFDRAAEWIGRAVALQPLEALFHNNMGNVELERGRVDEALACYRRALALAPGRADVCNNLGVLLSRRGQADEAGQLLLRARALEPDNVDTCSNLANHYLRHDRVRDALQLCVDAQLVAPRHPTLRRTMGVVFAALGMRAEAEKLYRAWLASEPDNVEARFRLTACTQQGVPERAPDDFVSQTFDTFADSFDAKLAALEYRAPELVADAVARFAPPAQAALDVIDAGCGTGLCGPLVRPWARRLVGVDLSPGMLDKARLRAVYDELDAAELVAFLQQRPASCELLVSADTLCYFGVLQGFAEAAALALRPGGLLVFSVEQHPDGPGAPDFVLCAHGRYSHRHGYVDGTLRAAGFTPLELKPVVLRMEASQPVQGWLVSARAGFVN